MPARNKARLRYLTMPKYSVFISLEYWISRRVICHQTRNSIQLCSEDTYCMVVDETTRFQAPKIRYGNTLGHSGMR